MVKVSLHNKHFTKHICSCFVNAVAICPCYSKQYIEYILARTLISFNDYREARAIKKNCTKSGFSTSAYLVNIEEISG